MYKKMDTRYENNLSAKLNKISNCFEDHEGDLDNREDGIYQDALGEIDETVDGLSQHNIKALDVYKNLNHADNVINEMMDNGAEVDDNENFGKYNFSDALDDLDDSKSNIYHNVLSKSERQQLNNDVNHDMKNHKIKLNKYNKVIDTFQKYVSSNNPKVYAKASTFLDNHSDFREALGIETSRQLHTDFKYNNQLSKSVHMSSKYMQNRHLAESRIKPNQLYSIHMSEDNVLNPLPLPKKSVRKLADSMVAQSISSYGHYHLNYKSVISDDAYNQIMAIPKEALSKKNELHTHKLNQQVHKLSQNENQKITHITHKPKLDATAFKLSRKLSDLNIGKQDYKNQVAIHNVSGKLLKYPFGSDENSLISSFKQSDPAKKLNKGQWKKLIMSTTDVTTHTFMVRLKRVQNFVNKHQFDSKYTEHDLAKDLSHHFSHTYGSIYKLNDNLYSDNKFDLERIRKANDMDKSIHALENTPTLKIRMHVYTKNGHIYNMKHKLLDQKHFMTYVRRGIRKTNKDIRYIDSLDYRKHLNKFMDSIEHHDTKYIDHITTNSNYLDTDGFNMTNYLRGDKKHIDNISFLVNGSSPKEINWSKVNKDAKPLLKHTTKKYQLTYKLTHSKHRNTLSLKRHPWSKITKCNSSNPIYSKQNSQKQSHSRKLAIHRNHGLQR